MLRCLVITCLLVANGLIGCCPTNVRKPQAAVALNEHLIFNPEWTGIGPVEYGREEWPSTVAYSASGEDVRYQERIIDWQWGSIRPTHWGYYRRFTSVRTGRAVR